MILTQGQFICDRCRLEASSNTAKVAPHPKGHLHYELCPTCWDDFVEFLVNQRVVRPRTVRGEESQQGLASRQDDLLGAEPKDLQQKAGI